MRTPGGSGPSRSRRRFGGGARARTVEEPGSVSAARNRAVGLLARRDYPSRALKGRLTEAGFEVPAAEAAVTELEDERLVNDARYVESAVASRTSRGQGPTRIAVELRRMGVSPELIAQAIDARSPDWVERAQALRRRRFGPAAPDGRAEQNRQTRFLLYRGFTGAQVRAALSRAGTALDEDLAVALDEDASDADADGGEGD